MKILKSEQYINEKLGIKPVTRERLVGFRKEPKFDEEDINDFIKYNNLVWNPQKLCYDCDGNVYGGASKDGKIFVRFGYVKGNFEFQGSDLKTLEGAPQEVGGNFICASNMLTSLEGAPQKVGGYFDCSFNNLESLEGAPKEVGGYFYCGYNNLKSLKGIPQKIGGFFDCGKNELKTIDYEPKYVGGDFNYSGNDDFVLPEEKPSWLNGEFDNI